jgi:hypothetical protein
MYAYGGDLERRLPMARRRHKGRRELTEQELERFLSAAMALHEECCGRDLAYDSAVYEALSALNTEIGETIRKLGRPVPWAGAGPSAMTQWAAEGGNPMAGRKDGG